MERGRQGPDSGAAVGRDGPRVDAVPACAPWRTGSAAAASPGARVRHHAAGLAVSRPRAQPPEPVLPVGAVAADMGARQAAVREYDHRIVAVRGERDLDGRSAWRQRVAAGDTPAEHDAVRRLDGDVGAVPGAGARAIGDDLPAASSCRSAGRSTTRPTRRARTCHAVGAGQPPSHPTRGEPLRPREFLDPRQEQRHDRRDRHQPPGRQLGQRGPDPTRPPGADAFGYKAKLRIDRKLAQLLRCGCRRSTTAPTASTSTTRPPATPAFPGPVIDTLTAWWETDFHDAAARAALAYTEALTRVAERAVAEAFGARHERSPSTSRRRRSSRSSGSSST